jgi:hypothetical protein
MAGIDGRQQEFFYRFAGTDKHVGGVIETLLMREVGGGTGDAEVPEFFSVADQ